MEMIDPNQLKDHPLNTVIYGTDVDDDFVNMVRQHGIDYPLLVTEDMVVVSGHRRKHAAIKLGISEVPCIVLVGVTDARDIERRLIVGNHGREKTTEQKAREVQHLHKIEAERAAERRKAPLVGNTVSPTERGRSLDIAAKQVGLSPVTARKAEKVLAAIDDATAKGDAETAQHLRETLNESVSKAEREVTQREPDVSPEHTRARAALKTYDVLANHVQFLRNNIDHRDNPGQFRVIDAGLAKVHEGLEWCKKVTK